jgi:energy-converting hydrogenase B subunit J
MIDFVGALIASFILGFIIGSRIRRVPAVMYVVLFLVVLAVSFFVGDFPFYQLDLGGGEPVPMNTVFITSFLGLVFGSLLLGGGSQ